MGSKRYPKTSSVDSSATRSFTDDDRAIEGLPIRLVIALIIGVMSLGIMLQILGGIDTFGTNTEVDVEFDDATIDSEADSVSVFVVDEDGNEVVDTVVIAEASSVRMDGALDQQTGDCTGCDDNEVQFNFDSEGNLELPPDQSTGEIEFLIQPPSDSNWVSDEPNNKLLVIE